MTFQRLLKGMENLTFFLYVGYNYNLSFNCHGCMSSVINVLTKVAFNSHFCMSSVINVSTKDAFLSISTFQCWLINWIRHPWHMDTHISHIHMHAYIHPYTHTDGQTDYSRSAYIYTYKHTSICHICTHVYRIIHVYPPNSLPTYIHMYIHTYIL